MSELPEGWLATSLRELCEFENGDRGKNYAGRDSFVDAGIPMISAGHLDDGAIEWSEMNYIPSEKFAKLGSGKVRPGDFLFCLRGSLGKFAYVEKIERGAIASSLVIIRPDGGVAPGYFEKYLRSPLALSMIKKYANGVAQPNLSSKNLGKFEIPLPPLAEQKRIVEKLDSLTTASTEARTALTRVETLVEQYRQAVLSTLTTQGIDGGGTPSRELEDVSTSVQYGYTAKSDATYSGPAYLRITDIQDGAVDWSAVPKCEIATEDYQKYKLWPGDIVFARTGATVGKSFLIRDEVPDSVFASYLIRVSLDETKLLPEFLYYHLQSADYWKQIKSGSTGTGQPNFNGKKLKALRVPTPSLERQKEIVAEVKEAFAQIDTLANAARSARERLDKLDRAVLAKAFRGELVPQDPSDEPASELLKRLQKETV